MNRFFVTASPIILLVAGLGMVMGLDYVSYTQKRAEDGAQMNFVGYLSEIPGRVSQTKADIDAGSAPPPTLAAALPGFLGGWQIAPFEQADFDRMAQIPPRELTEYEIKEAELKALLDADPGAQMVQAQMARDVDQERITLTRGDDIMILTLTFRSERMYRGLSGGFLSSVQDNMMNTIGFMDEPFATVQGVPFRVAPIEESPEGRRFRGHLGKQVDVSVQTNADDEAVLELLSKVNFSSLNAMLMEPVETVDATLPTLTAIEPGAGAASPALPAPVAATEPEEPAAPPAPTVRRPGDKSNNCRVENGVRRCTIGGN
ncbi:hypothetical protein [Yoonia sp. R2-816]|uniref:hypothetical protein n=1 Tax=Yoonia sp. R2-816 TaxID=3342638 RepID=UPI0037278530